MVTNVKQVDEKIAVKKYKIQHSIDEYTFPKEAVIHMVRLDEKYINVELADGRIISIPLKWIPTVYNASPENRKKFEISQNRTMIIWNPDTSGINDEISILDYLGPTRDEKKSVYIVREPKKRIAESKKKLKKSKK
ncbi:MAG: DUF2442 domain-containing protein [Anaerolineales bacterium]|nr:DUF2442 domain-containing protein [Anaerolineales bacterium]MBX3036401.1 DUF2442 domain-containing protein [Anaerolineales bacterium]